MLTSGGGSLSSHPLADMSSFLKLFFSLLKFILRVKFVTWVNSVFMMNFLLY